MPRFFRQRIVGRWVDPRGYTVLLRDSRWSGHILLDHPDMAQELAAVQSAIERPDSIHQSVRFLNRQCYYRQGAVARFPRLLVKVVVEMHGQDPADVRTAHLIPGITPGETRVW